MCPTLRVNLRLLGALLILRRMELPLIGLSKNVKEAFSIAPATTSHAILLCLAILYIYYFLEVLEISFHNALCKMVKLKYSISLFLDWTKGTKH